MENGTRRWKFQQKDKRETAPAVTVRGVVNMLTENVNPDDARVVVQLGRGDPSACPSFQTAIVAEDAVVDAVRSAKYNCYTSAYGFLPARR